MSAPPVDVLVEIGKQGTGWLVAGYFFILLIKEKDKRLTEAQTNSEKVLTPIKNLQDTMDAIKILIQTMINNR